MPEGDTIHRTAARLRPALEGRTLVSFRAPRLGGDLPSPGEVIERVEARGKYLRVHFGGGATLETHMKMSGSWHLYRVGERWRRSAGSARVVIETDRGWQAVCFAAPHVRLLRPRPGGRDAEGSTGHLGPDLCGPDPELGEAVRRFDLLDPTAPAVDALLDQRVCCGVGNVYKSEVLHLHRIHPGTPIAAIDDATRRAIVDTAHRLLRRNLVGGARMTTTTGTGGGPNLAVYGRLGEPCLQCGTAVLRAELGRHHRSTYWCPACQPERHRPDHTGSGPEPSR